MKINFIIFLQLVFLQQFAVAQYKELAHKPYNQQMNTLQTLYMQVQRRELDSMKVNGILKEFRAMATEDGDERFYWEAEFLAAYFDFYSGSGKLDELIRVQKETEYEGQIYISSRILDAISLEYWSAMEYEESLKWHLHLDEMLKDVDVVDFPDKAIYLTGIGSDYRFFGDFERAISYFKQVAKYPIIDYYLPSWRHALNNLGNTYKQLGNLDSSDYVLKQLLAQAKGSSDQWVGIASGNLGYNQFLRGDFDAAIPFFETDIAMAEKFKDFGLAVGSCIPLADIYTQKGQLEKAKGYIDKAIEYIEKSGQTDRFRNLYPMMSKWESAMNHPDKANEYLDSSIVLNKRYNEKYSALQLMRANQVIQSSQKEKAIQKLEDETKRNKIIRNAIIGGLLLVVVVGLIIFYSQQQKNQLQRKLKDLELEQTQQELENAKSLLNSYTNKIHSNSLIISSMEYSEPSDEQSLILENLKASTILTEEDWENFQIQFRKIFPELIENLQALEFNLSPAEMRYILLLKLELPTIEIAHALGISPSSLRVTWHRLRKKLDLNKDFHPSQIHEELFSEL